jgi:hypothetical protein
MAIVERFRDSVPAYRQAQFSTIVDQSDPAQQQPPVNDDFAALLRLVARNGTTGCSIGACAPCAQISRCPFELRSVVMPVAGQHASPHYQRSLPLADQPERLEGTLQQLLDIWRESSLKTPAGVHTMHAHALIAPDVAPCEPLVLCNGGPPRPSRVPAGRTRLLQYCNLILDNQSESLYHLQRIMSDEGCTYSPHPHCSAAGRLAVGCCLLLCVCVPAGAVCSRCRIAIRCTVCSLGTQCKVSAARHLVDVRGVPAYLVPPV